MSWHGMAWHGMAWHGVAWRGRYKSLISRDLRTDRAPFEIVAYVCELKFFYFPYSSSLPGKGKQYRTGCVILRLVAGCHYVLVTSLMAALLVLNLRSHLDGRVTTQQLQPANRGFRFHVRAASHELKSRSDRVRSTAIGDSRKQRPERSTAQIASTVTNTSNRIEPNRTEPNRTEPKRTEPKRTDRFIAIQ
ncbi:hypothetical protein V9T40_007540 [Parthenolecanium corni]|uniref:Uncharacterized protein n=1 Tax=Parthenolecanium corni TaxID=536013 RepID=A0AAN9TK36_9HEMI